MIEPFIPMSHWIKWKDIQRCPYHIKDPEWSDWNTKDDNRLFFIALDRYADYLKQKGEENDNKTQDLDHHEDSS